MFGSIFWEPLRGCTWSSPSVWYRQWESWFSFSPSLQVVAITVFFLLSVAYYAFLAPFIGKDIYEYIALGVYSVLVSTILELSFSLHTFVIDIFACISFLGHHFRHSRYSFFMFDAQLLILLILEFCLKLTIYLPVNLAVVQNCKVSTLRCILVLSFFNFYFLSRGVSHFRFLSRSTKPF